MIRQDIQFSDGGGRLTRAGYEMLQELRDELDAANAKLAAIAAIVAPSGGATIDTQARTAIAAVIAACA